MTARRRTAIRCVAAGQAGLGAAFVFRPALAVTTSDRGTPLPPPTWVVRLLGARMTAQGLAELSAPRPLVARVGAAIDVIHVATMLAIAARSRTYRRPALRSAALAAGPGAALIGAHRLTRR